MFLGGHGFREVDESWHPGSHCPVERGEVRRVVKCSKPLRAVRALHALEMTSAAEPCALGDAWHTFVCSSVLET